MHLSRHHAETSTTITPASVATVRRSCDQAIDHSCCPFSNTPIRLRAAPQIHPATRQNPHAAARDRIDPNRVTDRRIVLALRPARRTRERAGQGLALVTRKEALAGRRSVNSPKRPNSAITGGVGAANCGRRVNLYFRRKSQIFEEDPVCGAP